MTEYKRDLELKESVAIVISRIIGSGILRHAMTEAGFSPITTEWWHFDSFPYKETKTKFMIIE